MSAILNLIGIGVLAIIGLFFLFMLVIFLASLFTLPKVLKNIRNMYTPKALEDGKLEVKRGPNYMAGRPSVLDPNVAKEVAKSKSCCTGVDPIEKVGKKNG